MLYPQKWKVPKDVLDDDAPPIEYEGKLLAQARDQYHAKLNPIQVRTYVNEKDATWQDSYTKLLAWNQTQYKRHMDELFLLPTAPVAMPRAYWLEQFFLSSQLIVIEPSEDGWQRVQSAMEHHEGYDYDMDILNKVFDRDVWLELRKDFSERRLRVCGKAYDNI
ncbi:hypothetical protein J4E93_010082 [Alternaria ventricosa]|uniref:uncharacterized protein n=1 Tax=Alternaria ventricosa TaxID=1187951 RepID=UPI0020C33001|nr:uncharacterized protein J4E93_010082 [Alternaria ventricosa]KAI4638527.1 hypothetical protein J4E93_010082 [Alternaria ventricosa]